MGLAHQYIGNQQTLITQVMIKYIDTVILIGAFFLHNNIQFLTKRIINENFML